MHITGPRTLVSQWRLPHPPLCTWRFTTWSSLPHTIRMPPPLRLRPSIHSPSIWVLIKLVLSILKQFRRRSILQSTSNTTKWAVQPLFSSFTNNTQSIHEAAYSHTELLCMGMREATRWRELGPGINRSAANYERMEERRNRLHRRPARVHG